MVRRRMRPRVNVARLAAWHLPQRRRACRLERRWRSRYARMAENRPDRRPLGDEGDDPHLAAALRAQQWQHLLDADQQQRPDMARRFAMRRLRRVANRPLRLGLCSRVSGDDIGLYERPRQCGNCRS